MEWLYVLAIYLLIGLLLELGIDRSMTLAEQFRIEQPLFGRNSQNPRPLRILAIFAWPISVLWAGYVLLRRLMDP